MDQALIRIGEELRLSHKDLSDELLLIRLEQRAGKPRIEAWRNMANRTGLEIFRSFVNMLVQTERFGTPLSKSLGYFADSLRTKPPSAGGRNGGKDHRQACISIGIFHLPKYVYRIAGAGDYFNQQELLGKFWTIKFRQQETGDLMDNITIIRVISGVLFVVVLFILIQRRKNRAS